MLSNPVFLSVVLMLGLCLARFNVFLAILISGLFAGVYAQFLKASDFHFIDVLQNSMNEFISGMSGNLETSISYVLVGAIAAAVARSNLTAYLVHLFSKYLSSKKVIILSTIAFFSCFSQNLIPIHIAFIPILIPPLMGLFKKIGLDRRAVACAITFGITTPYITLPLGFGLIYHNIISREISKSGLAVTQADVSSVTWIMAPIMIIALIASMFYYGRKKGVYGDLGANYAQCQPELKFDRQDAGVLAGLLITLVLQIVLGSLPLASLVGFLIIILTGGIKYSNLNEIFGEGFAIMGYVAFIMLVAAGYGSVLRDSGAIEQIVSIVANFTHSKLLVSFGMMLVGLLITLGIGSSFGTIPIIATIFTPICLQLGFSPAGIIFLIAAAGFIGDTGSPASEATLGVVVGINADNMADHIKDVCIPTMIFYNVPLIFAGALLAVYL